MNLKNYGRNKMLLKEYFMIELNIKEITEIKETLSELKKIMSNKKGKSLDVTLLDKDLANLLEYIRNQGYYFAE